MKNKQKGFVFIPLVVIIAAAILVSGGIVVYQKFDLQKEEGNTHQPSASVRVENWETFTDSTIGVSFKYPSEWHTKQINTNPFFLEIVSESGTEKILVSTIDPSSNGQLYVAGKTGKGGYLVSDWQANGEAGQNQKDIVFTKNGVPHSVIFMATHASSQKLLDEIIETLVFSDSFIYKRSSINNTNQSGILSSTVTADEWRTYSNVELQLTFKYPSSYDQVLGNTYPVQVNKRLEGDVENAVTISKFTSRAALDLALQGDNELLLRDITEVRTPITLNGYEVILIDKTTDIGQRRSMIIKGNSDEWFLVTSDIEDRSIVNTLFKTIFLSPYPLYDLPYTIGALYDQTKSELAAKGWFPVTPATYIRESGIIPNSQTPIDLKYPEIAACGTGSMKICTVTFKKDISSAHLNLREGTGNQYGKWVVLGTE